MIAGRPVPELDSQLKRVLMISGIILAAFSTALAVFPRDGILWGVVIGIMVGMYNSLTLANRIRNLPDLSRDAARKHMNRSLFFRFGLIMAVLFFVSQRLPFVSLLAVGAGILLPSYVSIALSIAESFRLNRQSQAFLKKYYEK